MNSPEILLLARVSVCVSVMPALGTSDVCLALTYVRT